MGNTHLKALYQSIGTVFHYLMFYGIQEFGVIRFTFEFSTLKKCHTEERSEWRIVKIKQWKSRRHRLCHGATEIICEYY